MPFYQKETQMSTFLPSKNNLKFAYIDGKFKSWAKNFFFKLKFENDLTK